VDLLRDRALSSLVVFATEYGTYALQTARGTVPGGPLAIWAAQWVWAPGIGLLLTFVPLLFPTGRLPSRRWRPVAWLSALPIALIPSLTAPALWPHRGAALIDASTDEPLGEGQALVVFAAFWLMVLCGLACLTALAFRFRRSRGIERQQLKWFLFACAITVTIFIVIQPATSQQWNLGLLLALPVVPAIPVAAGIAILRYRLYEIDRLVNRTVVYGVLTVILGLGYASVVLVLGQLFGGATKDTPSWAVAGATLTVAALFQPARRHTQALVDRRFNRRKYDAAKTVEAFSARLRDEVDLDSLSDELLALVDQTMQPTHASLWLRPASLATERAALARQGQVGR
jgi:glucan phosphoethanolaminetransferase (alkaline phosphatase superfamily)